MVTSNPHQSIFILIFIASRDLGHDLRRVRALGVGCIIWFVLLYELLLYAQNVSSCLDDDELELLGASWPQYSEVAQSVGLDVLRYV